MKQLQLRVIDILHLIFVVVARCVIIYILWDYTFYFLRRVTSAEQRGGLNRNYNEASSITFKYSRFNDFARHRSSLQAEAVGNSPSRNTSHTNSLIENYNLVRYMRYGPSTRTINRKATYPIPLREVPEFFSEYLTWHEAQMICVRNRSCYSSNKSSLRLLVWQCPSGKLTRCQGIGDRMRGIISSLALAMMTGRIFLLMWPDNPYPFLHAVSPAAIDWRVPPFLLSHVRSSAIIDSRKYKFAVWIQCPHGFRCVRKGKPMGKVLPKQMRVEDSETYKILSRHDIRNIVIWMRFPYSKFLYFCNQWHRDRNENVSDRLEYTTHMDRLLLRSLFRPSVITQRLLHSFIPPQALQSGYVSIHARTGQDVREAQTSRFRTMKRTAHGVLAGRFMMCALKAGITQNTFIVFVSDSLPLKLSFAVEAKRHGMFPSFSRIRATHVAQRLQQKGTKGYYELFSDQKWRMFINTFVEFFAIANGTKIIANRSEFSRLAYLLSNVDVENYRTFNSSAQNPKC